jgi:hypothetical protein
VEVRKAFGAKYFYGADIPDVKSHHWLRMEPERIVTWDFGKIPAGRDGRAVMSRKEATTSEEASAKAIPKVD